MLITLALNYASPKNNVNLEGVNTPPPPAPRLRRLLLVCVSFAFSFQFFSCLAAVFAEEELI